jgi:hypothetical protein
VIVDPLEVMTVLGVQPGTRDGALVSLLHKRVERLVKQHVRHNVEQDTHVEFLPAGRIRMHRDSLVDDYSGVGGNDPGPAVISPEILAVSHVPLREVLSLHLNEYAWGTPAGTWTEPYLLAEGADFVVDWDEPGLCRSGHVVRSYSGWPLTPRTVRISYSAGWTPDELDDEAGDYKLAVLQASQKFFNEVRAHHAATDTAGTGAVQTETMDGAFFSFGNAADNFGLRLALPASVIKILESRVRMSGLF